MMFSAARFAFVVSTVYSISANPVTAEIVLDGSMGQSGAVAGPDYAISENMGQVRGNNLFHSFSDFNLNSTESATFNGSANINNIISRVTGGNASTIDGILRSNITGANLYLINPDGIVFGANASLDVTGSFYATTLDYLSLGTVGRFDATQPGNSVLTAAPPSAFGFIDSFSADISVFGSSLSVTNGQQLAFVGGDILISGNSDTNYNANGNRVSLSARLGEVSLVAVGAAAAIGINGNRFEIFNSGYSGNITIENSEISSSGDGAGTVFIRGGNLVVRDNSLVHATNSGAMNANAVGIDIDIQDSLDVTLSTIKTDTTSTGSGGDTNVTAASINLVDEGVISANSSSSAQGGDINVTVGALYIEDNYRNYDAGVVAFSYSDGSTGNVNITAESITMTNYGQILNLPHAYGASSGDININTGTLNMSTASFIQNNTYFTGLGYAGNIYITANDIVMTGVDYDTDSPFVYDATGIKAGTYFGTSGDVVIDTNSLTMNSRAIIQNSDFWVGKSGDITINFDDLNVLEGSQIVAGTYGVQDGGSLFLSGKNLLVSGVDTRVFGDQPVDGGPPVMAPSLLASQAGVNGGQAGDVNINVESLSILDGGRLDTATFGSGDAGDINIDTNFLEVSGYNQVYQDYVEQNNFIDIARASSLLTSATYSYFLGNAATGNAGDININATEISISDAGIIQSLSFTPGNAGEINFTADNISVTGNVKVSARAYNSGQSGNITLSVLDDFSISSSNITTESTDSGAGGNIELVARELNIDSSTVSTGSSGSGDGGSLKFVADRINLKNSTVTAQSTSLGIAGDIDLSAVNDITMDGTSILTRASVSDGGNIKLLASDLIYLRNSNITASVVSGVGNGGNINIDPVFVVLNQSSITADAQGGNGGNITLIAENYIASPNSRLSASSNLGVDGAITVSAPNKNFSSELEAVPEVSQDVSKLFRNDCVVVGSGYSRFITEKAGPDTRGSRNFLSSDYSVEQKNLRVKVTGRNSQYSKRRKPLLVLADKGVDCMGKLSSQK